MKTYIITGGSSGIGAALVALLAQSIRPAEMNLINVSRRPSELGGFQDIKVDLSKKDGVELAKFELKRRLPSHNLGEGDERYFIGCAGAFDLSGKFSYDMMMVNLYQHYELATLAASRLGCKGIVLVSSVSGIHGEPDDPMYAACKAGLIALTSSLAAKYPGVKVNCVAPGFIKTPMESDTPNEQLAHWQQRIPERRRAEPREIAELILYLLTAPYVNGATLVADGGLMAGNWCWPE